MVHSRNLRVYFHPDDIRVLYAYLPNGEELGPLTVARPWNISAHSLRLRQAILRMRRQRQVRYSEFDDPVLVWANAQRKQMGKRSKAKHAMVEVERQRRKVSIAAAEVTAATDTTAKRPARPKSLAHLGKGPILR